MVFAPVLPYYIAKQIEPTGEFELTTDAGEQFVFDGVNGLTFPKAVTNRTSKATITNFRSKSFFERLLEALK